MSGENFNKIKFNLGGKDFTLRLGENIKNEKKNLDLGSIWDEIDKNDDNKLDRDEYKLFAKLNSCLNKDGKWENLDAFVKEFEKSGKNLDAFLNEKMGLVKKMDTPKAEVKVDADVAGPAKSIEEMELDLDTHHSFIETQKDMDAFGEKETKRIVNEVVYDLGVMQSRDKEDVNALNPKYNQTYTVRYGDTMGKIAIEFLKEEGIDKPTKAEILKKIGEIMAMNPQIESSHRIYAGMEIKKPTPEPPDAVKPVLPAMPTEPPTIPTPLMTPPAEFPDNMEPNVTPPDLAVKPADTIDLSGVDPFNEPTYLITGTVEIVNSDGSITFAEYDADGKLEKATVKTMDAYGNDIRVVEYDKDAKLVGTTEMEYDSNRVVKRNEYGSDHKFIEQVDSSNPDEVKTTTYPDAETKVTVVEDSLGAELYTETSKNNGVSAWSVEKKYPDGRYEKYELSAPDRIIEVADATGAEEFMEYNGPDLSLSKHESIRPGLKVIRTGNETVVRTYKDNTNLDVTHREDYEDSNLKEVRDYTYHDSAAGVLEGKDDQTIVRGENGEITKWTQERYDAGGNWVGENKFDKDGKLKGYTDDDGTTLKYYDRYGNEIAQDAYEAL